MKTKSDHQPTILYVVNDLIYFRAHREMLANAMARRGFRVVVMSGNCANDDALPDDSFELIHANIVRQSFDLVADVRFASAVRRWVRANKPELVHMITIKPVLFGTLGLVLPTRVKSFRLVWTMPGLGKIYETSNKIAHRLRRWLTTTGLAFAARRSEAIVTVENTYDRQRLVDNGITRTDNIHVIDGTGLDLDLFSPPETEPEGPVTFLMATRLLNAKGVVEYVEAARQLKQQGSTARFLLAGLTDSSNPDAVDPELIAAADVDGIVEWVGAVAQTDMPSLLQNANVFCLPTKLQEGLPRSLMEAAACGCALIAPDQAPIRKLLRDPETGWLIPKVSTQRLIETFELAAKDPSSTRDKGKKGAAHIRSLPVGNKDVLREFHRLYGLCEEKK